MKKIAIVVAMFMLASPVWAVVDVNIIPVPIGTTGDVNITYVADVNISGFGLDITVDSGANITAINNFHIGESNSTATGFGIFPGRIDINDTTGDVDDYGTPVAPGTDGRDHKIVVPIPSVVTKQRAGLIVRIQMTFLIIWFLSPSIFG